LSYPPFCAILNRNKKGDKILEGYDKDKDTLRKYNRRIILSLVLAIFISVCMLQRAYAADAQEAYPIALSEEEIQMFNAGFFNVATNNMNNMLLASEYEKPEEIDLFETFYNGVGTEASLVSKEEIALLTTLDSQAPYLDIVKITAAEMDAVLQEKLGVELDKMSKIGLENFYYLEPYDSFYIVKGDTNFDWCTVISGNWWSENTVSLEYEKESDNSRWIVTLQKTNSGFQFVSNKRHYKTGMINANHVIIQSSADADAAALFVLNEGINIKILAQENHFYQIAVHVQLKDRNDSQELFGFVDKEFVTLQ